MIKKSLYSATYGKLSEMFGMDRSDIVRQRKMDASQELYDAEEEPGEYDYSEEGMVDIETMSDAQDIASMAAQQHSGGNIDILANDLGHEAHYREGQQTSSAGEVLIADIKQALDINQISYTEIFRKFQRGEMIVSDIDFMNNLG